MFPLLNQTDNLLLYGLTGSGKTTQLVELIKAEMKICGKKALVYVTDGGGSSALTDVADIELFRFGTDPFVWIDGAVQGKRFSHGKWLATDLSNYCLVAMESLSGMSDMVLNALGKQVAAGQGTDAMKAPSLIIKSEGHELKVASNSPTHYGMAQKHLLEKVWQSQLLPVPVVWTAHEDVAVPEKRDESGALRPEVALGPAVKGMIGPLVAGHAMTLPLPKYFVYTFRLKVEPTTTGKTHILYTERHKDGMYEGLANNRAPFGTKTVVAGKVMPANVVQVLQQIQAARAEAKQRA